MTQKKPFCLCETLGRGRIVHGQRGTRGHRRPHLRVPPLHPQRLRQADRADRDGDCRQEGRGLGQEQDCRHPRGGASQVEARHGDRVPQQVRCFFFWGGAGEGVEEDRIFLSGFFFMPLDFAHAVLEDGFLSPGNLIASVKIMRRFSVPFRRKICIPKIHSAHP